MFAIIVIYIMLFSFTFIIITSLGYLVYIDWWTNRFDKRVNNIHNEFSQAVLGDLENIRKGHTVDDQRIKYVTSKLKRNAYEKVFQNTVLLFANEQSKRVIPIYMMSFEEYLLKKAHKVKPNGTVKHVQNAFMFGEFRYNHPVIMDYLLKGVQSQSIFVRFNSMSAISKIGNADVLVESLKMASNQRRYMNMKVLTDIIDNFEGEKTLLNKKFVNQFMQFGQELRLLIINYFYNELSEESVDIFSKYLMDVTDKEEHISLLKYFNVIQHPASLPRIVQSLKSESWEIRAIAAKTLANYIEYFDVNDVMKSLSDDNWYVRTNAASSILKHLFDYLNYSQKDVEDFIARLDDKYAVGAIEYARHLHEKPLENKSS